MRPRSEADRRSDLRGRYREHELFGVEHRRVRRIRDWPGPRIVAAETKAEMKKVLADIQSGKFTRDWMLENKVNQTSFKATRAKLAEHPIEEVGAKLRDIMPWIKKGALVDKTKN